MKIRALIVCFVLTLFAGINSLQAQDVYKKSYTVFVFQFTKHITWETAPGSMTVGVVGDQALADMMNKILGAKGITIKPIGGVNDAAGCNIVFLSKSKSGDLDAASAYCKSNSVLLVTDVAGGAKKGATISFTEAGGKIKFELSKTALASAKLKASAALMNLAVIVD